MTREYAGLVAFDAVVLCVGLAWVAGLRLADARRPVATAGLAFFTGWIAVGVALALAVSFGVDPSVTAVLGAAVLAGACGLAFRLHGSRDGPRRVLRDERRLAVVGAAGAVVLVAATVTQLLWAWRSGADSSWDVWSMWEAKGRALYFFHGYETGPGGVTTYAHPDYPPFVTALIAAQYHFMGGPHATRLPFQQGLLSISFFGAVVALVRSRVPAWILYPTLAALAAAPRFWERMQSVLPDQAVAYFVAVAAVALILWLDERRGSFLALATLALAACALAKNEGVLLGTALVVAFGVAAAAARAPRARLVAIALLGPLAIVPWKWWLSRHGLSHVATDYAWRDLLHPGDLARNADRLGYASGHMLSLLFDTHLWTWVVVLGLAAVALALFRARTPAVAILAWAVISFLGQLTVYWIGRLEIQYYVATSAERVVGTLPIVLGAAAPLLLALSFQPRRGPTRPAAMERTGIEPVTYGLQSRRSPS
jgi:hypothetical protein